MRSGFRTLGKSTDSRHDAARRCAKGMLISEAAEAWDSAISPMARAAARAAAPQATQASQENPERHFFLLLVSREWGNEVPYTPYVYPLRDDMGYLIPPFATNQQ